MAKYGVVETSDLKATHAGHIYNLVDDAAIMENGMVVKKGDLVTGELECYQAENPAAGDKVVLIAQVPLIYDQSTTMAQAEYNFYIEEGTPARAYELYEGDRYRVSDYLIAALGDNVVKGNYVVATAGRKYEEKATLAGTEGFAAKILDIKTLKGEKRVLLEVVKNVTVG